MSYIRDKKEKRDLFHAYISEIQEEKKYRFKRDKHWLYCKNKERNIIYPHKGFKIHLSATINNAYFILKKFYAYAKLKKFEWKVLFDYRILERQNLGQYGYSQIGKFITIYPENDRDLCSILSDLELIYKGDRSISIPSDFPYMNSQIVYYRYGDILVTTTSNDPRQKIIPKDILVPIDDYYIRRENKLPAHIFILDTKRVSGKGAVYEVFNIKKQCITFIKKASFLSNVDIYGVDAINRLHNEKRILSSLESITFVPKVIDDFYIGENYFLEISKIQAKSLWEKIEDIASWSNQKKVKLTIQIASLLSELLKRGVIYNDLSFSNVLMNDNGKIFIIDFEYCTFLNYWNFPSIIAGSIGFYSTDYNKNDEKKVVFSIAAFLLNLQFFDSYIQEVSQDNEQAIRKRFFYDFYKGSQYRNIFKKAFSFQYNKIGELKKDLEYFIVK